MKHLYQFRLSHTVAVSMSVELFDQIQARVDPMLGRSVLLRDALTHFFATLPEGPDLTPLLKTAPRPNRTVSVSVAVKSPELRQALDKYATDHDFTASAIVRRAAYEYTKPDEPNPTATLDGWGDRTKS